MFGSLARRAAPALARRIVPRAVTFSRPALSTVPARSFASSIPESEATIESAPRDVKGLWPIGVLAALAGCSLAYWFEKKEEEVNAAAPESGLNPKEFVPMRLAQRIHYNHNTDLFVFDLKDKDALVNLPVASYLVTRFKGADGKDVIRPYTPIHQEDAGTLQLLVKAYPQGVMSKHIHELKVGDTLDIKGPLPKFPYQANDKKVLGMIAGGTGITPMLQILHEIVKNPDDKTAVKLVFANTSREDILLKEEIDQLAKMRKNIEVTYLIDKPEKGHNGPTGYINADLLKKTMPPPSSDVKILVCGPPGMMNLVSGNKTKDYKQGEVTGVLKELGYDETNVFKV